MITRGLQVGSATSPTIKGGLQARSGMIKHGLQAVRDCAEGAVYRNLMRTRRGGVVCRSAKMFFYTVSCVGFHTERFVSSESRDMNVIVRDDGKREERNAR